MERIKKLLTSQTIKDTSISFLGLGFSAVVGFVFTVILARTLGPEQFGVFSAISSLIAIVYSMGDLGVASALINFIPKFRDGRQEFINTSFIFEIAVGFIVLIVFSIFATFHGAIIPGSLPSQILFAGVLALNYLFMGFIQGILTAERRFLDYSLSQIIDAGIKIAIVFILLSLSKLSISSALLANVISTIVALAICFGKEFFQIKLTFDKSVFRKLFDFAKWIAVTRVFSVFISRIDVILLNLLSNSFQAGIFAAANRITLLFALLVSSLGAVINPRFSGFDNHTKVISYIKKLLGLITLVSLLMLATALLAGPIINMVFGDKYLSAIPVFQALTIAMIPFIFSLATTPALIYTFNKPKFVAFMSAFQVILIIIFEVIFIPYFGAYAPPIALGVTNSLALFISGFYVYRLLNTNGQK